MTVAQIKAELDRRGVKYGRKARKAELESLLAATVEAEVDAARVAGVWIASYAHKAGKVPPHMHVGEVVAKSEPVSPAPPGGGSWIFVANPPEWARY